MSMLHNPPTPTPATSADAVVLISRNNASATEPTGRTAKSLRDQFSDVTPHRQFLAGQSAGPIPNASGLYTVTIRPSAASSNHRLAIGASVIAGDDTWIGRFQSALSRFAELRDSWDSAGAAAPSRMARESAADLLETLWKLQLRPSRIAPEVEGGIVVSFFGPHGRASVDCSAEGELFVVVTKRSGEINSWNVDHGSGAKLEEALFRLGEEVFLAAPDVSVGEVSEVGVPCE